MLEDFVFIVQKLLILDVVRSKDSMPEMRSAKTRVGRIKDIARVNILSNACGDCL